MVVSITDPRFSTLRWHDAGWKIETHEAVTMIPAVEGSVLHLSISDTLGANWHAALSYAPFAVAAGRQFAISFAARAARPFTFSVWLGQSGPPFGSLVAEDNHFGEQTMTTAWQTYTHRWCAVRDEPAARLHFVLGQIDNHVELRDIALVPGV